MKLPTLLRQATTDDVPFITDSWLRTYRKSPYVKGIPSQLYFPSHRDLIECALSRSEVFVAQNETDANQIYGYIVIEEIKDIPCLHYIYVKQVFRRFGIAKLLMTEIKEKELVFFTHFTRIFDKIQKDHYVFNPYLFTSRKDIYEYLDSENIPADSSGRISWS